MVLAVALCLAAAPATADLTTKFDFDSVSVGYSDGILNIVENATTTLDARIIDTSFPAMPVDVTKILDPSLFDLYLTATIVNPAGMNNIAFADATLRVTDTVSTLAAPSILADVSGASSPGDPDGVTFYSGILTVYAVLNRVVGNDSILLNPTSGDWTFAGTSSPLGAGLDGVLNRITVGASQRNNYDVGTVFVLETELTAFGDGTSTLGITNADDLFAAADIHDGFQTFSGDIKVDIVPSPGAGLLGLIGLGVVASAAKAGVTRPAALPAADRGAETSGN